ncbi:LTA synthase family protein [Paenibacillus lycopersici]|uniref:LTA synthase family protein n=1 Tax=Paenibacillus lycopersici TaxID=2704462 RepID=A0A6C0FYD5_9BACL|nr:LTA synthase family protein [Paenibacillus lycopersici]QHT62116.1 LTA synthase family protein [Paenibacillus lycopersici]
MTLPDLSTKRRRLRAPFSVPGALLRLDLCLFIMLMLFKLALFDRLVHVPYMDMNRDDRMVAVGTLALIAFWTFWLPRRGRMLALILLNLALTALVYCDLLYFRYFQDLITIPVLMQAGQVGELGDSIHTLLSRRDLWFFADWPFLLLLAGSSLFGKRLRGAFRTSTAAFRSRKQTAVRRVAISAVVLAVGFMLVFVPVHRAQTTWAKGLFTGNWWNLSLYNVTGVLGFHGYDLYRYADEHWLRGNAVTPEQTAEAKQWFADRGHTRDELDRTDPLYGRYKGKNVVLIQLEAFQSFVVGQNIGGQEVTPNINRLMKTSLYFDNFYHQTAQGRTSDADLAANASLQPMPTGSVFTRFAQHDYDSMAKVLKMNGYQANAYHAYDGGFWNRNLMYDTLGYDHFYSKTAFNIDEPLGWSLGDKSFFKQAVSMMKTQQEPFYSFLISLSSHHPYTLPAAVQTLDVGAFKGTMFGDYLEAIHYVDAAIGEMVDELKAAGLWDQSIFLFYGDHDNSIADWQPFESFLGRPLSEADRFRILKGVPFLVHLPDDARAGTYHQVGGQLDVTPTVLHLLGIPSGGQTMIGTPLVTEQPLAGKQVVFRSGGYTDGSVLYLPSEDGLEAHSKCYSFADGKPLADSSACQAGAAEARKELQASDLVVEHDQVPAMHANAKAGTVTGTGTGSGTDSASSGASAGIASITAGASIVATAEVDTGMTTGVTSDTTHGMTRGTATHVAASAIAPAR